MPPTHRALLVGVPRYRDPAITDLPFIEDDLQDLAKALESAGYAVDRHDTAETGVDEIRWAVEDFLRGAPDGQNLLLHLSGHGVHHDGTDYLVAGGARTASQDFLRGCLPLDLARYVEGGRAGDVAVFVDACREGLSLATMSTATAQGWSTQRKEQAGRRHYCRVYACSPGESARYTGEQAGERSFSLFSRALAQVVADPLGPRTLTEVQQGLQEALDELSARHRLQRQVVRVSSETADYELFPRPARAAELARSRTPWDQQVREHPVWKLTEDRPGTGALREAAATWAASLARRTAATDPRAAGDPWPAPDLADRMTDRVGWLLSSVLNPGKLDLSPAEAALLAVAPYAHAAYAHALAADGLGADPVRLGPLDGATGPRAAYEKFLAGQARLVRRADRAATLGRTGDADAIGWWLYHRWLGRAVLDAHDPVFAGLFDPAPADPAADTTSAERELVREVLAPGVLHPLLKALRDGPDLRGGCAERPFRGGTLHEQAVREGLVGTLLSVAHHLVIDPVRLPAVVAEHLGISFAVDLTEMHTTLRAAHWIPRSRTRVLSAACSHPAVGLALREHTAALDAFLSALDVKAAGDPQLTPLRDLPVHATADEVTAAAGPGGKPLYVGGDLRFRLADDRVQELLMGEQLYGDPAMAVRELYQNALDACRYREARTTFLRRRHGYDRDWRGRIDFTQGEDARGRPFVTCRDNGIGMGERELREVFSHAGVRFADLPEFLEEQAEWAEEDIRLFPNSRFGVGVLSYFMVADDITVTTCRLDRDGNPGRKLQVRIAGPGALFRITDLGPSHKAGTSVTLHLRSADVLPSCADLLRRLLWVSDYDVTAGDGRSTYEWAAGELSEQAPLGAVDPYTPNATRKTGTVACPTASPGVWWCSVSGGVLVDGLWTGEGRYGAVVNLTGAHAPALTVDRRRILDLDGDLVERLLGEQIPSLLDADAGVFEFVWLVDLAGDCPGLADRIMEEAVGAGYGPWLVGGRNGDLATVGCFATDAALLSERHTADRVGLSLDGVPSLAQYMPHELKEWRCRAWTAAGLIGGLALTSPASVLRALPSDDRLVAAGEYLPPTARTSWLDPSEPVPLGHVIEVARVTGYPPSGIARRLRELGYEVSETVPATVLPVDRFLLSRDLDGLSPWVPAGAVLAAESVLIAAFRAQIPPAEAAARLPELGCRPAPGLVLPDVVGQEDVALLSELRPRTAWLRRRVDEPDLLSPAQVVATAAGVRRPPHAVWQYLEARGYRLPPGAVIPEDASADDLGLLRRAGRTRSGGPALVPLGQLLGIARDWGQPVPEVLARLRAYGLGCDAPGADVATPADSAILSGSVILSAGTFAEAAGFKEPVETLLTADQPLAPIHVMRAALVTRLPVEQVTERLRALGYLVPAAVDVPEGFLPFIRNWRGKLDLPLPALVREAGAAGHSLHEAAEVFAALGLSVPRPLPGTAGPHDAVCLAATSSEEQPVSLLAVLTAAEATGLYPADVLAVLARYGLTLPPDLRTPDHVLPGDLQLLTDGSGRPFTSSSTGIQPDRPLTLDHILHVAVNARMSPLAAAARLSDFGYQLPPGVVFDFSRLPEEQQPQHPPEPAPAP